MGHSPSSVNWDRVMMMAGRVGSYDPWTAGDRYDSFDTIYPEIEQVIHLEASIRSLERSIGEQRRRSGN